VSTVVQEQWVRTARLLRTEAWRPVSSILRREVLYVGGVEDFASKLKPRYTYGTPTIFVDNMSVAQKKTSDGLLGRLTCTFPSLRALQRRTLSLESAIISNAGRPLPDKYSRVCEHRRYFLVSWLEILYKPTVHLTIAATTPSSAQQELYNGRLQL
jgi:hypothetical protein